MATRVLRAVPPRPAATLEELREVLRRCAVSRENRRTTAQNLRQWYEQGTDSGMDARYNKLTAHLDRMMSYLWAADSVRFTVHLPPEARDAWLGQGAVARDEFRNTWDDAAASLTVGMALEWALVYGATVLKAQPDPQTGVGYGYIDPWDFGVTREDQSLDDQDAMAHWYALSVPQFERWCEGHPRESELVELAKAHAQTPGATGGRMPRLVVTGITGVFPNQAVSGAFPGNPVEQVDRADAQIIEPIVIMADVWQRARYRDSMYGEFEDWKVSTVIGEAEGLLLTRRNPILPWLRSAQGITLAADHPFAVLTPRPLPGYLWGRSEIARLLRLQVWREDHVTALKAGVERQLDPPKFFTGFNDFEEAGRALSSPGGAYGAPDATTKMEKVDVAVPGDAFTLIDRIDSMFADQGGIPPSAAGEAQPNVRNTSQLVTGAGIGAGRIRNMALRIEDTVGRLATLGFQVLQRNDARVYPGPDGAGFLLAQLPPGTNLRVSAHSAAPIFAEQTTAKALQLFKAGAIDAEWLVELLDPPYREELRVKARELTKSRAQTQQQMMQIQAARYLRRGTGPGK